MDIEYLLFLQRIRESLGWFGEDFFELISNLAASMLAILIVGVIYWSANKKLGTQIGLAFSTGTFVTGILKNIFCVYRPWLRDVRIQPSVQAIEGASGYSFPSGHSQIGVNVYGTAATYAKKKLLKIFLIILVFLIAFSRNMLGVHTPQDVITGLIIGYITMLTAGMLLTLMEKGKNYDLIILFSSVLVVVITLIYISLKSYPIDYIDGVLLADPAEKIADCFGVAGITLGTIFGIVLERRFVHFTMEIGIITRILRSVIGAVFVIITAVGTKQLADIADRRIAAFTVTFSVFIVVTFIWPAIFNFIEHKINNKKGV